MSERILDISFGDPIRFTCSCGYTQSFDRAWYDAQPYGFAKEWIDRAHPHSDDVDD